MVSLPELAALLPSGMANLHVASDAHAYAWVVKVISWFFVRCAKLRELKL